MPVNRETVDVSLQFARPGARVSPSSGPGNNLRKGADILARQAAQWGEVMGQAAEEEGRALARKATFLTGPNGLPQMPPEEFERMGRRGKVVYDRTIEDRYMHELATSVKAAIADAENANLYDPEAFAADAQARLANMALDVPDGFQGAYESLVNGALVDSGISIGRRRATVEAENARASYPAQVDSTISTIQNHIYAGNFEAARMLAEDLDFIINAPDHVLNPQEKDRYVAEITGATGAARIIEAEGLLDAPPEVIDELLTRMRLGNDPELREYFKDPRTGDHSIAAEEAAISYLETLRTRAYQRQKEEGDRAAFEANTQRVIDGVATGTKDEKVVLDHLLARDLGRVVEGGGLQGVTWQTWLGLDDKERNRLITRVKNSKFLPTSLEQAFRRIEGTDDVEEYEALFPVFQDLKEAPNSKGDVRDMTEDLPMEVQVTMELARALHGDGASGSESVRQAFKEMRAVRGQEWTDVELARQLDRHRSFWGERVTEDNVRGVLRSQVSEIFSDVDMGTDEFDMAVNLYEFFLRTQKTPEAAANLVEQAMEGRWVDTKFMLNTTRSMRAPEKFYADPVAENGLEVIDKIGDAILGVVGNTFGIADLQRAGATAFEQMVDVEIRFMLQQAGLNDYERDGFDTGNHFFRPGVDYQLVEDRRSGGGEPVYYVYMRDAQGNMAPLGLLDVRSQWRDYMRNRTSPTEARKIKAGWNRLTTMLSANDKNAGKLWSELMRIQMDEGPAAADAYLKSLAEGTVR